MSETQSLASSSSSSLEDLELYSPPDAIGESEEDLDDSESPPMSDALSERCLPHLSPQSGGVYCSQWALLLPLI